MGVKVDWLDRVGPALYGWVMAAIGWIMGYYRDQAPWWVVLIMAVLFCFGLWLGYRIDAFITRVRKG